MKLGLLDNIQQENLEFGKKGSLCEREKKNRVINFYLQILHPV